MHQIYFDWCLYIACLCIYAYSTATTLAGGGMLDEERYEDPINFLDCVSATWNLGRGGCGGQAGRVSLISRAVAVILFSSRLVSSSRTPALYPVAGLDEHVRREQLSRRV